MLHLKFAAMVGLLVLSSAMGIALAQPAGGGVLRPALCESYTCNALYWHPHHQAWCDFTSLGTADICKGGSSQCNYNDLTLNCSGHIVFTTTECNMPFLKCTNPGE